MLLQVVVLAVDVFDRKISNGNHVSISVFIPVKYVRIIDVTSVGMRFADRFRRKKYKGTSGLALSG